MHTQFISGSFLVNPHTTEKQLFRSTTSLNPHNHLAHTKASIT
jgi:hypothetical protein